MSALELDLSSGPDGSEVSLVVAGGQVEIVDEALPADAVPAAAAALRGAPPPADWTVRRLTVRGRELATVGADRRVRAGLVVVGPAPVAEEVTVLDHLAAVSTRRHATEALDRSPLLSGRGDDPAGVLSGGERRVLWWLVAGLLRPEAVVLDGAGTGLDDATLGWCAERVADWRNQDVALVVLPGRPEERSWRNVAATDSLE